MARPPLKVIELRASLPQVRRGAYSRHPRERIAISDRLFELPAGQSFGWIGLCRPMLTQFTERFSDLAGVGEDSSRNSRRVIVREALPNRITRISQKYILLFLAPKFQRAIARPPQQPRCRTKRSII